MTNDLEFNQTCDVAKDFNRLDESIQQKLTTAIKSLAFLYTLADNSDDDNKSNTPIVAA